MGRKRQIAQENGFHTLSPNPRQKITTTTSCKKQLTNNQKNKKKKLSYKGIFTLENSGRQP
jgi:hypothetical protein